MEGEQEWKEMRVQTLSDEVKRSEKQAVSFKSLLGSAAGKLAL